MKLEGSCHCQAVRFSVESRYPYPFNICYCAVCRKTAGGGGYAINLSGDATTLEIQGADSLSVYQAHLRDPVSGVVSKSPAQRRFCRVCGSHLWLWDPRWPELLHPLAGAIDTELPEAPEHTHLMLASKPDWVRVQSVAGDRIFEQYPDESIADWHQRLKLTR